MKKIITFACLSLLLFSCADENNYAGQSITDSNNGGGIDVDLNTDKGPSTRGKGPREIQEENSNSGDHANDALQNTSDTLTKQY